MGKYTIEIFSCDEHSSKDGIKFYYRVYKCDNHAAESGTPYKSEHFAIYNAILAIEKIQKGENVDRDDNIDASYDLICEITIIDSKCVTKFKQIFS